MSLLSDIISRIIIKITTKTVDGEDILILIKDIQEECLQSEEATENTKRENCHYNNYWFIAIVLG